MQLVRLEPLVPLESRASVAAPESQENPSRVLLDVRVSWVPLVNKECQAHLATPASLAKGARWECLAQRVLLDHQG